MAASSTAGPIAVLAGVMTTVAVVALTVRGTGGQIPATTGNTPTVAVKAGPAPTTPWGEPDLQGIWTRDVDIPLQRPPKYANREFFTEEERAELDRQIAGILSRDSTEGRRARGTERDVNSEFSQAPFTIHLPVGRRTSLIVDPPTAGFLCSRWRPRRTGTLCDSSSSPSCNRRQRARSNNPAVPAARMDPYHRGETRRPPST